MQTEEIILKSDNEVLDLIKKNNYNKIFICCGKSFEKTELFNKLKSFSPVVFDNIRPNPRYEDMIDAVKVFEKKECDFIIGAGGGSPIDSAKMIKLLATNKDKDALTEELLPNNIPFMAIPTTSGTGAEVTRYSIFYSNETDKHSVSNYGFVPNFVVMIPSLLKTVPDYQLRCTCIDALCHAIESYWSVNSNDESREYAAKAIKLFFEAKDSYIRREDDGLNKMLYASFYAGKAINITATTAAHAMCYNITIHCHTSHGHSVGLNLAEIWEFMLNTDNDINDKRGKNFVDKSFEDIAHLMGGKTKSDGVKIFRNLLEEFELTTPKCDKNQVEEFAKSVNVSRLNNNPVFLGEDDIKNIYKAVFKLN